MYLNDVIIENLLATSLAKLNILSPAGSCSPLDAQRVSECHLRGKQLQSKLSLEAATMVHVGPFSEGNMLSACHV